MKFISQWLVILICITASCAHQSTTKDEAKDFSASLQTSLTQETGESSAKRDGLLKQKENAVTFGDGWRFETERISKQHTKDKFRVEIEYPRLVSDKNGLQARKFNDAMRRFINQEGNWALEDRRDVEKEQSDYWHDKEDYFELSYDIGLASNDFVSVEFSAAAYSWGAAHPVDYPLVFNFDLQRGKLIAMKDIFKPRSGYLSVLSNYCQSDLEGRLKTENLYGVFTENLAPKAKNFEKIVVTSKGLKVLLGECNVTPCAAGTQFVIVPFDVVKEMLNLQSPVARIARGDV